MPREVENSTSVVRLQPAQPNGYETQSYPFTPASADTTVHYPAGQCLGIITSTQKLCKFDKDGVAGEAIAHGLNEYDMYVDDEGNVSYGSPTQPDSVRASGGKVSPVFIAGVFDPRDLTGYVAEFKASWGNTVLANGFIRKA